MSDEYNHPDIGDDELKNIIQAEITGSGGGLLGLGSDLANQRRAAMEYYLQKPYGNEIEGHSKIVTSEVSDVIEWFLPALLEIFTASGQIFKFEPVGMEDEDAAKQATDYINHIFLKDNNGFEILYDWFKDALLQKNGIVSVAWDASVVKKRHTYTGLTLEAVQHISNDEGVEIIEHDEYVDEAAVQQIMLPEGIPPEMEAQFVLHDITIIRTQKRGRIKIFGVPPENFLISRRATSISDAPYTGDEDRVTVSELLAAGYDPELVYSIPTSDAQDWSQERIARYDTDDEWPEDSWGLGLDPAMRQLWITTSYVKVDFDGDGLAELRKVVTGGSALTILENIEVDDTPYCSLTPVPMPHKFFGLSAADWTMDIQLTKSTLLRQWLDNLYQSNNAVKAISKKVNMDDIMTPRIGGVIRVDTTLGDVGAHIVPQVTVPFGPQIVGGLEYMDKVMQARTGHSPFGTDGLPAELNKTATGITAVLGERQKRLQLIARIFAETGVKELGKKMLGLVIKHQDRARTIRLRGEWVEIDPRAWNSEMDVSLTVGLGYGSKDQQLAVMQGTLDIQQQIVASQGGPNGPLIFPENIHAAVAKWLEAGGMKNVDSYVSDPDDPKTKERMQNAPPKPPDPKLIEVQQKGELANKEAEIKASADQQAEQRHSVKDEVERERKNKEASTNHDREIYKIDLAHEAEIYKIELAHQRDAAKTEAELGLEEGKLNAADSLAKTKADHDHSIAKFKADPEGALDHATEGVDKGLKDMADVADGVEKATASLEGAVGEIKKSVQTVNTAVQAMNAPKEIIYKGNRAVGVKQGGKTRKIKYNGDQVAGLE